MRQIYLIKNIVNDLVYVGQSSDAYDRFRRHRNNLTSEDKKNIKLIKAFKEIGVNKFYFIILEECEDDVANEREQYYIKKYNSFYNGYNDTIVGTGYRTVTAEQIQECCDLFQDGMTIVDIETLTGINHKLLKKELSKVFPDYKKIVRGNIHRAVTKAKQIPVEQYDLNGNFIKKYNSVIEAAREMGVNHSSNISNCCKRKNNCQTAYGYRWEYSTQ